MARTAGSLSFSFGSRERMRGPFLREQIRSIHKSLQRVRQCLHVYVD